MVAILVCDPDILLACLTPPIKTALMYADFFEPPAGSTNGMVSKAKTKQRTSVQAGEGPQKQRESKVRFHEEVKVKLVKSRRNLLSLLNEDDDSDENVGGLFPFEEGQEDEDGTGESSEESGESSGGSVTEDEDPDDYATIEKTKDDLFAQEEAVEAGQSLTTRGFALLTSLFHSDLSTFAQRQLALKKQIEELELENVGKKDWTLMGEANSRSRPINSLLEEDLEFEHRQRVAPVITEEKVKSLEDLIRARILEVRCIMMQEYMLQNLCLLFDL